MAKVTDAPAASFAPVLQLVACTVESVLAMVSRRLAEAVVSRGGS